MSDSDSDSSSELMKVSSQSGYTTVPHNVLFKIKIKPKKSKCFSKFAFEYELKKGQDLPYSPILKGRGTFDHTD